jgi:transcriptional regulator with XRE-family HTH domain
MNERGEKRGEVARLVGDILREERKRCGLTQEELAAAAGLHRTTISLLERGVKSPTLHTLFRLCDALGIEPSAVVERATEYADGR